MSLRMRQEVALTFDDVLLLPRYTKILPKDAKLGTYLTREIKLNIPLLSAAMDTVTEAALAVALAECGGIGIIHQNMPIEAQSAEVRKVKKFESGVVLDPITVSPETTIRELKAITQLHNISGMPVTSGKQLLGIITNRDIRFIQDDTATVKEFMTKKEHLITVRENATRAAVMSLFCQHRVEKILVINEAFELKGMYTVKDILRSETHPHAAKTTAGQLLVGAAVGTSETTLERVEALVYAGVDVIVVDTAHGFSQSVLNTVRKIKKHYPTLQVVGGNIATADAALALIEAGADALKVGVGPGSICTTRVVTGVGMPQLSAIAEVCQAVKSKSVPVIADGGIRYSGDVCKALAAGAHTVMIGSLFAGTTEAPGEMILYQGRSYKSYRGMGSEGALNQRGSRERYFQDTANELTPQRYVPQGIEGRVPFKGSVKAVLHQLIGGIRACMGYLGAETVEEMHKSAEFVRISHAGIRESHVHDVVITKEAPNYFVEN